MQKVKPEEIAVYIIRVDTKFKYWIVMVYQVKTMNVAVFTRWLNR